ncbi:hypothetical protein [Paracraurococcus ruber]|uniref:Uncharacterized protein n=1 Tax=Paracraurococcus ruber TaxID=77675 RepID=A0ABS1CUT5_9PROT|nr:hypothetical protein [Paracraurococcus ruber]MBK1658268.1 hypothetical protein [Paracraurococcus ruber]TDG30729.1 hypothetical protein E2C05_13460 [Paracraurococcus ruber]
MTIRGSIDEITPLFAAGWAHDDRAAEPLLVQAMVNGAVVGEAIADASRPDLAAAGLGDGRCGFRIEFGAPVDPGQLAFVSVKPDRGDVELPRTNLTGYVDAFRALRARHPGVGWTRSIHGGLWTDRADARRRLAGRVAIGAVGVETAEPLGRLIEAGHVLLRGALAPVGLEARAAEAVARLPEGPLSPRGSLDEGDVLGALPALLFRDAALGLLRGAFDDQPLVCRAELARGVTGFAQPSTAEPLPSPTECAALVAPVGEGRLLLDIVRDSHALPEFTPAGESRWLAGSAASLALASAAGASLDTVLLGETDLAVIAPGTLYRLRVPQGMTALVALAVPNRQTPLRFLTGEFGDFTLRHHSGAVLAM